MKGLEIFKHLKEKFPDKKIKEILIVIFCIGLMFVIGGKSLFETSTTGEKSLEAEDKGKNQTEDLERKVSAALSNIKGAGKVEVLITYDSSEENVYAYETKSNKAESKREESNESDYESKIAYQEFENGQKRPVVMKAVKPVPKGAIVIAEGAFDNEVKRNLTDAVVVLLKLPSYQVSVFERKKQ